MLRAKKDTAKYLFDSIIYIWPRKLAFIYEIKAGRLQQWDKKKIQCLYYRLCKYFSSSIPTM